MSTDSCPMCNGQWVTEPATCFPVPIHFCNTFMGGHVTGLLMRSENRGRSEVVIDNLSHVPACLRSLRFQTLSAAASYLAGYDKNGWISFYRPTKNNTFQCIKGIRRMKLKIDKQKGLALIERSGHGRSWSTVTKFIKSLPFPKATPAFRKSFNRSLLGTWTPKRLKVGKSSKTEQPLLPALPEVSVQASRFQEYLTLSRRKANTLKRNKKRKRANDTLPKSYTQAFKEWGFHMYLKKFTQSHLDLINTKLSNNDTTPGRLYRVAQTAFDALPEGSVNDPPGTETKMGYTVMYKGALSHLNNWIYSKDGNTEVINTLAWHARQKKLEDETRRVWSNVHNCVDPVVLDNFFSRPMRTETIDLEPCLLSVKQVDNINVATFMWSEGATFEFECLDRMILLPHSIHRCASMIKN